MFKKILVAAIFSISSQFSIAEEFCKVKVCNKIERFSLSISSHINDSLGKECIDVVIPKKDAKVGQIIKSDSRWYQGSFNPTKKSVTRVSKIYSCKELDF
jgi:hypothetical protein